MGGAAQGEVEQIAMMKPKGLTEHEDGLLEYLEDIIGSDRFVEAAEEAAKKVEELNDQRTEKVCSNLFHRQSFPWGSSICTQKTFFRFVYGWFWC